MKAIAIAGLVVMGTGVLLILVGLRIAWQEFKNSQLLGGTADFVEKLTGLVKALGGQPKSTALFAFGVLLIFLGGVIAGVSALTA